MFKTILGVMLYLMVSSCFIIFGPSFIFLDIKPKSHKELLPKSFTGPLQPNSVLSSATKLFEGKLHGPESIAHFDGRIYTGAHDGFIYQIEGDKLRPIVRLVDTHNSVQCNINEPWYASRCGRPLGIKFNSKGILYVTEPSYGIFSVDLSSPTKKPTVKKVLPIEKTSSLGKKSTFLDDLAVDEGSGTNGGDVLYISDMSTKFDVEHSMIIIAGSDKGRLIKYDINADKIESVSEGIFGINGVAITDDKSGILFCETTTRKVLKYHISGPKKGQTEVFMKSLPGEPDNIRRSALKEETYWLAFASVRNASNSIPLDALARRPIVRKFIVRIMYLVGLGLETVGKVFGHAALTEFGFSTKTMLITISSNVAKYGMVVELDKNGNIINSLHSPEGQFTLLSEANEVRINPTETVLYLGSFANNYLGKLTLKR